MQRGAGEVLTTSEDAVGGDDEGERDDVECL
jgi:hypothetical protein